MTFFSAFDIRMPCQSSRLLSLGAREGGCIRLKVSMPPPPSSLQSPVSHEAMGPEPWALVSVYPHFLFSPLWSVKSDGSPCPTCCQSPVDMRPDGDLCSVCPPPSWQSLVRWKAG